MVNTYHAHGEVVYDAQIENMYRALKGWGITSGLAVSQRGAGANMSVDVASGNAFINGTAITKGSTTNVAVAAADSTKARLDIVTINSSGTIVVTTGNLESSVGAGDYYPPELPNNSILLALVLVQAAATQITNSDITDKRLDVSDLHDTTNSHDHDGVNSKTTLIVATGSYAGDGNDNRTFLHGLGRTPKACFIYIKLNASVRGMTVRFDSDAANYSMSLLGGSSNQSYITSQIKSMDSTNVTLGTASYVNSASYNYVFMVVG